MLDFKNIDMLLFFCTSLSWTVWVIMIRITHWSMCEALDTNCARVLAVDTGVKNAKNRVLILCTTL